ncbi:MAG: hypothetical protein IKU84_04375 [Clostridia bacterium]|nr:hypothetical protein [Clostridia bacterium]
MAQITNNIRCCATCAYWLGERTPNRLNYVDVKSRMDSAKCGDKGLNESRTYQAIYCCSNYRKWPVLK